MKTIAITSSLTSLALLLAFALPAFAYREEISSIRCGTQLVQVGDPKYKVLALCGEPDFVDFYEEEVFVRVVPSPFREDRIEDGVRIGPELRKEILLVEEWTYDRGPNRFLRHLHFRKGKLIRIQTGSYGFRR